MAYRGGWWSNPQLSVAYIGGCGIKAPIVSGVPRGVGEVRTPIASGIPREFRGVLNSHVMMSVAHWGGWWNLWNPHCQLRTEGVGGVKPPVSLTYRGGGGVRAPIVRPQSNKNYVKWSEKQSRVTITQENLQTPQFRLGPHWMSL